MTQTTKDPGYGEPEWAERARNIPHKPNYVDRIPDKLKGLGEVFFPIPAPRKGYNYPHHLQEYRYTWNSETLNAYLEQGSNYGIACAGSLVVLDIDNLDYSSQLLEDLPESLYQRTGSREGVHVFYRCEGFNQCASLKTQEEIHGVSDVEVGDIKGHGNSYVVGPGSSHPSGNDYGPLAGESIARIEPEQLHDLIDEFSGDGKEVQTSDRDWSEIEPQARHDFYSLDADDVNTSLAHNERGSNPFHGSSTGTNFMKNEDGSTFVCWRCDSGSSDGCVLGGVHYLAAKALQNEYSNYHCEHIRGSWQDEPRLHYHAWTEAVEMGLVDPTDPPYTVIVGFMEENGYSGDVMDVTPEALHFSEQELAYKATHR